MRHLILSLATVSIFMLAALVYTESSFGKTTSETRMKAGSIREVTFHSVLEGLYHDGVSNEAVDIILRTEKRSQGVEGYMHFIYGCPLCMPTLNAFLVYRQRRDFYGWKGISDTFGPGLSKEERRDLGSDDLATRLEVVHDLVERWLGRRLDQMRLTKAERQSWQELLEESRKRGFEILEGLQKSGAAGSYAEEKGCAICDGANDAGGR